MLLYVGEARGGCSVDTLRRNTPLSLSSRRVAAARYNADASFFDLLEARRRAAPPLVIVASSAVKLLELSVDAGAMEGQASAAARPLPRWPREAVRVQAPVAPLQMRGLRALAAAPGPGV